MHYYLKLIGTAEDPLPVNWIQARPEVLNGVRFGGDKPPPMRKGDVLVYYAVGSQRLVGILDVLSDRPTKDNPPSEPWTPEKKFRWPWWIGLRKRVLLPADERAPHATSVGIDVRQLRQKSYLPIIPDTFRKMEAAIEQAERRMNEKG